eukprot:Pgem_evm1s8208
MKLVLTFLTNFIYGLQTNATPVFNGPSLSYIKYAHNSQWCIAPEDFPPVDGTRLILKNCDSKGTLGFTSPTNFNNGQIVYMHKGKALCLEVPHISNDVSMELKECTNKKTVHRGRDPQVWDFEGKSGIVIDGDRSFEIVGEGVILNPKTENDSRNSLNSCVTLQQGRIEAGSKVISWGCHWGHHQQWRIVNGDIDVLSEREY